MNEKILVVNPGSTSTKIAIYDGEKELFSETLRHNSEELQKLGKIADQKSYRKQLVADAVQKQGYELKDFAAISCRGGLVQQIPSGTYRVSDQLVQDSITGVSGQHASNLGALIGHELECESGVPAYIIDPPSVNELSERAKYSGHPLIERTCVFHALNQKAVARRYAAEVGKKYEDLRLLVCHMGGGISVGAHLNGQVVDTEDCVGGEGPFSPERTGSLPNNKLIDLCYSGEYTKIEMKQMTTRRGGILAYTGTNSVRKVIDDAAAGDQKMKSVLEAFYYQIAKEIGAMSMSLGGKVDQIILTGGIAHGKAITSEITKLVDWIAPVTVYPGEDEMLALAQGVLRVIRGEEKAKTY